MQTTLCQKEKLIICAIIGGDSNTIININKNLQDSERDQLWPKIDTLKKFFWRIKPEATETKTRWLLQDKLVKKYTKYTTNGRFQLGSPDAIGFCLDLAIMATGSQNANHIKNHLILENVNNKPVRKGIFIDRVVNEAEKLILFETLADRSPCWLDSWLSQHCFKFGKPISWYDYWVIMKKGKRPRVTTDASIQFMIDSIPDHWWFADNYRPLGDIVLLYPELLRDDIWQLFKTNNTGLNEFGENDIVNLDALDKECISPELYEDWFKMFNRFMNEGIIDRQELLNHLIDGMSTPHLKKQMHVTLREYYALLNITQDEKLSRQNLFFVLLNSNNAATQNFALREIEGLLTNKQFDIVGFLNALAIMLSSERVSVVRKAISMLKQLHKSNVTNPSELAKIATLSLNNASKGIQELLIAFLATLKSGVSNEYVVQHLFPIVARYQKSEAVAPGIIKKFNDIWEKRAVDKQHVNIKKKVAAPLRANHLLTFSSPLKELPKIHSQEQLLEILQRVIEEYSSLTEQERLLITTIIVDAISRFSRSVPFGIQSQLSLLSRRFDSLGSYQVYLAIKAWIKPSPPKAIKHQTFKQQPERVYACGFMNAWFEAVRQQIERAEGVPILATPTHENYWVAAEELVDRVIELVEMSVEPLQEDFILALNRLSFIGRDKALIVLKNKYNQPSLYISLLAWALGDQKLNHQFTHQEPLLWIAATRARKPYITDVRSELGNNIQNLLEADIGPGSVQLPAYQWHTGCGVVDGYHSSGQSVPYVQITIGVPESNSFCRLPYTSMHYLGIFSHMHFDLKPADIEVLASSTLHNMDSFYIIGIDCLMLIVENPAEYAGEYVGFLDKLLINEHLLTEMACLLLIVGLVSKQPIINARAVEILMTVTIQQRLPAQLCAKVLERCIYGGWVKLNRLAKAIQFIIDQLAYKELQPIMIFMEELFVRLLQHSGEKGTWKPVKGLVSLLEIAVDQLQQQPTTFSSSGKKLIKSARGSSKSAKLMRELGTC